MRQIREVLRLAQANFIEGQGAVSDDLTPVLLAISEGRVAITRETRGQNP